MTQVDFTPPLTNEQIANTLAVSSLNAQNQLIFDTFTEGNVEGWESKLEHWCEGRVLPNDHRWTFKITHKKLLKSGDVVEGYSLVCIGSDGEIQGISTYIGKHEKPHPVVYMFSMPFKWLWSWVPWSASAPTPPSASTTI